MFLVELFGKGRDTEKFDSGYRDGRETYKFTTSNGQEIVVDFLQYKEGTEIVFTSNDQTKATGAGEQFEIFATVMNLIKEYADRNPKAWLKFSADNAEPSRVKLYHKMVKRFAPQAKIESDKYDTDYIIPPRETK